MIEEDKKKTNEIAAKLKEIQGTEQINAHGIMIGSVLTVTIIEARDLRASRITGGINPYVEVSIEEQS